MKKGTEAPRVLISGGGTGGHVYPAIALAAELRRLDPRVELLYVGTREGLEADIVPRVGLPFTTIRARGLVGKSPLAAARAAADLALGYYASRRIIRRFRPHVAVGMGGYVMAPVMYAAWHARVPLVLHEQNALPGSANRWLSRFAAVVAVPFAATKGYFPDARRVVVVGNPVRPEILAARREDAFRELGLTPGKAVLVITSGSRGAQAINEAAIDLLTRLHLRVYVIWGTGHRYYQAVADRLRERLGAVERLKERGIHLFPYLERMDLILAAADLVIARAGATTIAELTARGVPSVLIPSPNVTHDHQRFNAQVLARAGAAVMLREEECTGPRLADVVQGLLGDPDRLRAMAAAARSLGRPDAGSRLAQLVLSAAWRERWTGKGSAEEDDD